MGEMIVIEYRNSFAEQVKDLFLELQDYISSIDDKGIIKVPSNYREDYFHYIQKEVEAKDGKIFLAVNENHVVGCVVCKIILGGGEYEKTEIRPKIGFIDDLIVTERFRGLGIGSQLLLFAEMFLKREGCSYIQLEVFASNKKAFNLYKKLGYGTLSMYMSKTVDQDTN